MPPSLRWAVVGAGVAVLCVPAILLAERLAWPQAPWHAVQLLAVVLCFLSSVAYLWRTRWKRTGAWQWVAWSAIVVSGLWLGFVGLVLITFDVG